jgi:hypothetical protein
MKQGKLSIGMMSAPLKVLGHDDRAVGFALREKRGASIARGGYGSLSRQPSLASA